METYIKAIQVFLTGIALAYDHRWPTGLIMVIEFLHAAGTKPCSPLYPKRFQAALNWFEKVGGWPCGERLAECELVTRTVAYWTDELRSGSSPLKQAPRVPWCIMLALELFVVNETYQLRLRLKGWVMLYKAWATLREDDAQHILPSRFRTSGELILTELLRSKTTGSAKRVRQLPVALWIGRTLARTMWIEWGLGRYQE